MKKDNKTMMILDKHFGGYSCGFMLCAMVLSNVISKGMNTKTTTDKAIDKHYDIMQKEEMPDETIDDDGTHHIKCRFISIDAEREITKATNDIIKAFNAREISTGDFVACCANFFKA